MQGNGPQAKLVRKAVVFTVHGVIRPRTNN
jgi:hypothetical protein